MCLVVGAGCPLGPPAGLPARAPGFLTAWQLGPEGEHPKRSRRKQQYWSDLASEMAESHGRTSQSWGEGTETPPPDGGVAKTQGQMGLGVGSLEATSFGK